MALSINWNVVIAIGIVVGLILINVYVTPVLKKKTKENFYDEVQLALLLCGYCFRDDKVKLIASIALDVVSGLEEISTTNNEKQKEAINIVAEKLLKDLKVNLSTEALSLIVKVAVSKLPATNK